MAVFKLEVTRFKTRVLCFFGLHEWYVTECHKVFGQTMTVKTCRECRGRRAEVETDKVQP